MRNSSRLDLRASFCMPPPATRWRDHVSKASRRREFLSFDFAALFPSISLHCAWDNHSPAVKKMLRSALAGFVLWEAIVLGVAFDMPSLPNIFNTGSQKRVGVASSLVDKTKANLLDAVSNTNNGKTADIATQKRVLELVRELEQKAPPSPELLSDPQEAMALDGTWYLQYTSPSDVGDQDQFPDAWKPNFASEGKSNIETRQYQAKGSVSAAGISVDTSNRVTTQNFDIANSRVENLVDLDFGRVRVAGPFRQSPNVPNRAIVGFEDLTITIGGVGLNLGFVFSIIALLRQSKDNGWLETTYLDQDIRIGRGNKGTMFVLTRDPDAVTP